MEDRVQVSITDGVADVRMVRADKMNALDAAMFAALVDTSERLGREKGLRAVVLSGEGRAFCAGLDMGRFAAMKESGGDGIDDVIISPSSITAPVPSGIASTIRTAKATSAGSGAKTRLAMAT